MALNLSSGYAPLSNLQDASDTGLPLFNVERVQLQFSIAADFVAAQVANNVLILALATGRILRIDLDNPTDIDGELYSMFIDDLHGWPANTCRKMSTCLRSQQRLD